MKLLSVQVENFRCIRKARVDFAPGLNVLHGPNDLGKSSLAHAIRAAFLLQSSTREHLEFVSWNSSGEPYVELVFESEPQRIWRVKKTFGTASSYLEWSKDGVDFGIEARGRDVDGKLSEILRWGVAPPGGKGRPKGMPISFLSTALLPEQDRVAAIFDQQLAGDSDESGKKQLIAALQAMAEAPLFKAVLERVQERVDEAFNSSGDKKRGKNSPWVKLNEELHQKAQRHHDCLEDLQKTSAIELELQQLRDQQLGAKEIVSKELESVARIEEDWRKQEKREEILARLHERQQRLAEIEHQQQEVESAKNALVEEDRQIEQISKLRDQAKDAVTTASLQEQKAKEDLARLESGEHARERQLQQRMLEKQQAELREQQIRREATLDSIGRVEAADEKVRSIEKELRDLDDEGSKLQKQREEKLADRHKLEGQERELEAIRAWFRWQTAHDSFQQAEKALAQIGAWKSEAANWRKNALTLESAQPKLPLPSRDDIENFRRLESDLRVARAKLEVGLSVTLRPKRPIRILVQRDGAPATRQDLSRSAFETTARREMSIEIEDVAEVAFSGGAQDARQESERLERRWTSDAVPALAEAGVATLDELARVVSEAAQGRSDIETALREADQFDRRIADQPDWTSVLKQRQQELTAAEAEFRDWDPGKLAESASKLRIRDAPDADMKITALRSDIGRMAEEERKIESAFMIANTRCSEKKTVLAEAQRGLVTLLAPIGQGWKDVLRQVQEQQSAGQEEINRISAELKRLAKAEGENAEAARSVLSKCEQAVAQMDAKYQDAERTLQNAALARAQHEGTLKARQEAVAQLDDEGARLAVETVRIELEAEPAPLQLVTRETLIEARGRPDQARFHMGEIEGKIREKRGALQQVGGEVAKQRAEDAATELEAARARERQMELEFNAWELLRQTLREAEQEEGTHLGRALADPIAKRFSALTGGSYGQLALGPNLETQGIAVAGEDRAVNLLSVGTRDQLSTIFRLTLAEELKTAVILDDQLTQTDSVRMSWLRDLLKEVSANIQVIVFTCRAEDYVAPVGGTRKGVADGKQQVRTVDLTQCIQKWKPTQVV